MLLPNYVTEDIKKSLYVSREDHKCYLEAWRKVTRNRKKDGSDYQNINKNFNGAKIDPNYSIPWLTVWTENGAHYIHDCILVEQCESIDEMFKAIADHIEKLQKIIDSETSDLDNFNEIITSACNEIQTALDNLKHTTASDRLCYDAAHCISREIEYYCHQH